LKLFRIKIGKNQQIGIKYAGTDFNSLTLKKNKGAPMKFQKNSPQIFSPWKFLVFLFLGLISCGGTTSEKGGEAGSKDSATIDGSNNTFFPPGKNGGDSGNLGPDIMDGAGDFIDDRGGRRKMWACAEGPEVSATFEAGKIIGFFPQQCTGNLLEQYYDKNITMAQVFHSCFNESQEPQLAMIKSVLTLEDIEEDFPEELPGWALDFYSMPDLNVIPPKHMPTKMTAWFYVQITQTFDFENNEMIEEFELLSVSLTYMNSFSGLPRCE
jgi:hypothetical protein